MKLLPRRRWLWLVAALPLLLVAGTVLWSQSSRFRTFGRHAASVRSVAFSPDGAVLRSVSWDSDQPDRAGAAWDPAAGREISRFPAGSFARLSADARRVAVLNRPAGAIDLFDTATGERRSVPLDASHRTLRRLALSADGSLLALAREPTDDGQPGRIDLADPDAGRILRSLDTGLRSCQRLAFAPDGRMLASCEDDPAGDGPRTGVLRLLRTDTGAEVSSVPTNAAGAHDVAFSPDGALVAVAAGRAVTVWDAAARPLGPPVATLPWVDYYSPACLAFSPDGRRLAVGGSYLRGTHLFRGALVRVWDTAAWQPQARAEGPINADMMYCLAFAPDSARLAFGTARGHVGLLDLPSPRQPAR